MNDIAHKVTERLYGDDEIKCELISYILNNAKKDLISMVPPRIMMSHIRR